MIIHSSVALISWLICAIGAKLESGWARLLPAEALMPGAPPVSQHSHGAVMATTTLDRAYYCYHQTILGSIVCCWKSRPYCYLSVCLSGDWSQP